MTIYSVNSEILYEAPLTDDALIKYELMGDYYIELPFDAGSYIDIPRGSYIDHEGTKYTVMENILPEPKDEGGYHYAVKFWAGQSFMKNRKLFWLKGANKEASFHITTTIDQFGQLVVDNMNEFMPGKWELSSLLPADALTVSKTISFEGDSCWDAVSSIAEAYGIEWWVRHDYDRMELYFGKLEGGNLVDFKVGEAITSIPSQKGDDSQYGTRFYVYGSNQNLPDGYGDTEDGGTVHHVSNPRLMLPAGIEYIDVKRDMTPAEIIEQVVIFEDVYPKNTDTVTAVTTVQRPIENAAEGQPQTFTAYQLIAANTPFLPSDVMENETLRLVFNSGALTGVEFEVDLRDADDNHIDPFKWKPEDGFIKKFELIAITEQVGDTVETLPDDSIHPVVGDEFVLLGVRLSDDKVREAEEELLQRGEEWKDEHSKDTSVYNCPTNPVYCKRELLSFALGQHVRLYDPRFDGGYRDSRIQGFEKRIWNEYIATYTIGDNAAYTRIGAVESSVTNLKTTERTIGMILDELAGTAKELSTMFEMVEYNKTKMIRANYDFFSVGGVTAGGIGSSSGGSGGGGSTTLAGLNDVALKSTIANDMLVYNGTHWVNTPMSAIKPDLTAYATKSWVEGKGYALNASLLAVDARLANVETIFTADQDGAINKWSEVVAFLDGIEGDTLDSILSLFATMQWVEDKKYITADALAPYALKTAIPTNNNQLENGAGYITSTALNGYATQDWVEGKKYLDGIDSAMVTTALGYTPYDASNFTKANIKSTLGIADWALALSKPSYAWSEINNRPTALSEFADDVVKDHYLPIDGTAVNADMLGNQLPSYYATAVALSALNTAVANFKALFDELFEKDSTNNAIKAKLSLYSVGAITAGGSGSNSGGSSEGGVSYDRLDAWADYSSSKAGYVLSALLGKDLDTRVNALANAGYITASALDSYAKTADVANTYATKTALQGVDIRVQAIEYIFEEDQDGVINKWQEIVDFLAGVEGTTLDGILDQFATKDSLSGYMPKTGGTFSGNVTAPTFIGNLQGNADSATKIATARTIWGQSFDGTGNVSGALSGVSNINGAVLINSSGNVGIGTSSPTEKLEVNGNVKATTFIGNLQGNADSANYLGRRIKIGANGSTEKYQKFATVTLDAAYQACEGVFIVNGGVYSGVLRYYFRSQASVQSVGIILDWVSITHTKHIESFSAVKVSDGVYDLYYKRFDGWNDVHIECISPTGRLEMVQTSGFVDEISAVATSGISSVTTQLATPRTIWGQSFDGTGDVGGTIQGSTFMIRDDAENPLVGLTVDGKNAYFQNINGNAYIGSTSSKSLMVDQSGSVGIGTTNPTSKLYVEGDVRITDNTTIEKNLWVDKNIYLAESESNGGIYFGDDEYAFIKETPDDVMTIASNQGLILRVNHISDEGAVIKLDGPVRIGDAILSWDATNKCITIKNANTGEKASLFVDGGITGTVIN